MEIMEKPQKENALCDYVDFVFNVWRSRIYRSHVNDEDLRKAIRRLAITIKETRDNGNYEISIIYAHFFKENILSALYNLSPLGYFFNYNTHRRVLCIFNLAVWMINDTLFFSYDYF